MNRKNNLFRYIKHGETNGVEYISFGIDFTKHDENSFIELLIKVTNIINETALRYL